VGEREDKYGKTTLGLHTPNVPLQPLASAEDRFLALTVRS